MIETLIIYDKATQESQLQAALFFKDTPGQMDDYTLEHNLGLKARADLLRKPTEMIGRLHSDIFHQEKYLLNRVDINIRLIRASPAFYLMSDTADAYKIKIMSACFVARKAKISPSLRLAHEKALSRGPAQYPISRVLTNVFSIPAGAMSFTRDNLFSGVFPSKVIICMVPTVNFNGSVSKNPFNFAHNNVTNITLYQNDEPVLGLNTDFSNNEHMSSYIHLFQTTHTFGVNGGPGISRDEYKNGSTLFAIDNTPDLCDSTSFSKKGVLRLEIKFKQALAETTALIIYAEFANTISCSKNRTILLNYSV